MIVSSGIDLPNPVLTNAVYRINWLRKKARMDRWNEECTLLRSEMDWTRNFFKFKMTEWQRRAEETDHGKQCYAYRQMEMWDHLYGQASEAF